MALKQMGNQNEQVRARRLFPTVLVYFIATALFLAYGFVKRSRVHYDDFVLAEIEILHPATMHALQWSLLVAFWLLLLLSLVSFKTKWLRWPVFGIVIAVGLYPCSLVGHTVNNLGPWTIHGQVVTDGGKTFVFCDSSFLQGQLMAIAEVSERGRFKTKFRVLVSNSGDSPRSWASVIRPAGASDDYGQLYLKNGYLIGVPYDNRCYLAYHLENEIVYGHGDIESLSPFVCLVHGDSPRKLDVQRICERIEEWAGFCEKADDRRLAEAFLNGERVPGCPVRNELVKSFELTDAGSIAKSIIECYDRAFEKLTAGVAK